MGRVRPTKQEEKEMGSGKSDSKNVTSVMDFNNLMYDITPDLSVCTSRSNKESFFQLSEYTTGSVANCILNTGSELIHPRNSYITFETRFPAESTSTNTVSWNNKDTAYNFFESLVITDRAGNQIERIEDVSILAPSRIWQETSQEYLETVGSNFGYEAGVAAVARSPQGNGTRWCIPLRWMSGLFDIDQLLPAQLCSGLRLQIRFRTLEEIGVWASAPDAVQDKILISNCRIVLDSCKMTDSVARQLNLRSANNGLEIEFRTWASQKSTETGATANVEQKKAVSRAFKAWAHMREESGNPTWQESQVGTSNGIRLKSLQWRAGNLYFPQQPLRGTTPGSLLAEVYHNLLQMNGKLDCPIRPSAIKRSDYAFGGGVAAYSTMGLIPVDLIRSTVQEVSGIPLNNSRVLVLNAEFTDARTRYVRIFMEHLRVARLFMDNTETEE